MTCSGLVLAVVVISDVLPRHQDHEPEPRDIVRKDLHRLFVAQEMHAAKSGGYANPAALADFTPSAGVRIESARADSTTWQATLRHEASGTVCSLRAGPNDPGQPKCTVSAANPVH